MYWPTGPASRLSLSSTLSTASPLVGTTPCSHSTPHAPIGLFATWTTTELIVWNPKPKIAVAKLARTQPSLSRLGHIHLVRWKPDQCSLTLLIWTVKSFLIVYTLEPLPESCSVYNLPIDPSSPFLSTGPADRIPFPKLVLQLVGEVCPIDPSSQHIDCLELAPDQIILGISGRIPQFKSIPWDSLDTFFSSSPSTHLILRHDLESYNPSSISLHSAQYYLSDFDWLINPSNEGRGYIVQSVIEEGVEQRRWIGSCFHDPTDQPDPLPATGACAINFRFNLVALGLQNGIVNVYTVGNPAHLTTFSHSLNLDRRVNDKDETQQPVDPVVVNHCAWTSDGHALAVSRSDSFSVWSVFGRLQFSSLRSLPDRAYLNEDTHFEDYFLTSCKSLFWGPGNFDLFLLTTPTNSSARYIADHQLFVLSFAKSAVATLHSPDNTKHAFLQLDDRVSVYRGIDCTDLSIINPESDVWQQVKIPADYISTNWPIEFSCISDDGLLLAVAGKRGFTHFNLVSGRWKLFESEDEEQSIHVSGGMQWFESLLVTGIDEGGLFSIRLFARENPLSLSQCLFEHALPASIVLLSIHETSLLVYTADNTLYHFIIKDRVLIECGSIGFEGVIGNPLRARGMSWLIPDSQHCFGEPSQDLNYATIIFFDRWKDRVEFYWTGRQFNPVGPSNLLQNSLWAWDGFQISVWLDALLLNRDQFTQDIDQLELLTKRLRKGFTIPLDFHPLSVLIDKGIIVGVEQQAVIKKSLKFALFKMITKTELFIHRFIKFYLGEGNMDSAVEFGSYYSSLVYFGHSLEMLLHTVLEEDDEESHTTNNLWRQKSPNYNNNKLTLTPAPTKLKADRNQIKQEEATKKSLLPPVVEFIDHFNDCLQVVVGYARKIDVKLWAKLFHFFGNPRDLFERSVALGLLNVACSYLPILNHYYLDDLNLAQVDLLGSSSTSAPSLVGRRDLLSDTDHRYSFDFILDDTLRLFEISLQANNWPLCKEIMRFSFSLDLSGNLLNQLMQSIRHHQSSK